MKARGKSSPVVHARLLINVVQVGFDGSFGKMEPACDLFVAETSADKYGDLMLAWGQSAAKRNAAGFTS